MLATERHHLNDLGDVGTLVKEHLPREWSRNLLVGSQGSLKMPVAVQPSCRAEPS